MLSPEVETIFFLNSRVNTYKEQLCSEYNISEPVRYFSGEGHLLKTIYKCIQLTS